MSERTAGIGSRRPRTRSVGLMLAGVLLLGGCDLVDAHPTEMIGKLTQSAEADVSEEVGKAIASGATDASGAEGAVEAPAADPPRQADMESIGPEGALRVYYQFVDDAGAVQFVERLRDVPVAWRDRVGYLEMAQAPPLTPADARRTWNLSASRTDEILRSAPAALASRSGSAAEQGGVILYSATWCGYCTKARRHLDDEGVAYQIKDVDIPAISRELREKTGRGGVPVLDFGGEILRGYSNGSYDRAIASIRG